MRYAKLVIKPHAFAMKGDQLSNSRNPSHSPSLAVVGNGEKSELNPMTILIYDLQGGKAAIL